MTISTYSELQTAAGNWLNRSDLTSRLPEFIALAESRFNRILNVPEMEAVEALRSRHGSARESAFAFASGSTEERPSIAHQIRNILICGLFLPNGNDCPASGQRHQEASSTTWALTAPPSMRNSATEIGSLKRRGPALPGLT